MPKNFDPFDSVKIGKGLKSAAGSIVNKVRNSIAKSNQERKFNELNPPTYKMKQEDTQKQFDTALGASSPMGIGGTVVGKSAIGFDKIKRHWSNILDKQERAEISDKGITIKKAALSLIRKSNGVFNGKLGDLINHKELFKKYPLLKETPITLEGGYGRSLYNPNSKSIEITGKVNYGTKSSKKSILHEIQHAIQHNEKGRSAGANDESIADMITDDRHSMMYHNDDVERLDRLERRIETRQVLDKSLNDTDRGDLFGKLKNNIKLNIDDIAQSVRAKKGYNSSSYAVGYQRYMSNLGEAEARETAMKMGKTKTELDSIIPLKNKNTLDVHPKSLWSETEQDFGAKRLQRKLNQSIKKNAK